MRDENLDKVHEEHTFTDQKGNEWNVKVKEDKMRKFRIYSMCNGQNIGRPLYFTGKDHCFEYLNKLLKNKNLKEI